MSKLLGSSLVVPILAALLSLSVMAQDPDATLIISVKDQFGLSIDGAEATLSRSEQSPQPAVLKGISDRHGSMRFVRLAAGSYKLVVVATGFREQSLAEISIANGETKTVNVSLEVAPIESNVDVGEDDNVPPGSAGSTVINEEVIANLPADQEAFEQALKRLGQAVTGEDLPITVDGVPGGKIPPKDAIQQVRVNQNVFSAQYEGPWGGGIEIFTRQGLKKLQTYVGFMIADSRFNASDPFLGRRVPYQLKNFFSSLNGPLFGKKASFFLYGSHTRSDSSSVINAIVLNDDLLPVEFKDTLATPTRTNSINLNFNADPNPKNKIGFSYGISISAAENQNTGGFSLASRANDTRSQNHWFQFSHTYLKSQNVVNQTRLVGNYSHNKSSGGSSEAAINVLDAFFGGGSQQDSSNGNLRYEISNETTWQMGKYSLGFGGRIRAEHIDQDSMNNFGGTYTFSGRIAPVLDENDQPLPGQTFQISSLEAYRRTLYFGRLGYSDQQIRELGGGANQFTISGGDPQLTANQADIALYVQNSYKLSETLAASFGVRYETQSNIGGDHSFAPRFGLIWSPKAKDKQDPLTTLPRISIGYGIFYSRFGLSNTVAIRQASDGGRLQYLITDPDILDLFPAVPTVADLQQFALPQTVRRLGESFQTPLQAQLNISTTKRLPKGYSLSFSFAHSRFLRQQVVRNINAPLAGTFDPNDPSTAVRPFGDIGNVYETDSLGSNRWLRYNVSLSFPQSQTLFGSLRYTYTSARTNVASSSGSPFDPYDFSQEYGPSTNDGTHSFGGFFSKQLPHKLWISSDFSIATGMRFNITTGRDTNGDGSYSERPAFASDPTRPGVINTPYGPLDPDPLPGSQLIPRNLGRGSPTFNFNGQMGKTFGFGEDKEKKLPPKRSLNISLRVQNIFNVINRGRPVGNMASPNFLRSLSSNSDDGIFIINGARQENFAGRSMTLNIGFSF